MMILISLVRNKAIALLIGAGGMGFNSLLTSMQNFAFQITNLGISFGAVPRLSELYEQKDEARIREYVQVVRLWSMLAALMGLLFCLIISPMANQWAFTWGDHTLHYAMLGFSVAMMTVCGGETAILKATRQLGLLARAQIGTAVAGLLFSVPVYYYWRHSGVVPVIVATSAISLVFTMSRSIRIYPFRMRFNRSMFRQGVHMISLGLSFIIAAAIGSGADMLVRAFLNVESGMDDVGLYNAAYMITITYAGLVFTAMETDYFPRLSAKGGDIVATNETVNKQIEVSLLMLAPMLVALLAALPILIPLLLTAEFLPVVGMAQVAVLAMYFKVLTLPVAYITLARGYSLSYLFLETTYYVVFVIAIMLGFKWYGIYGTGVAIVVAHVFDYFLINGYAYWKYGYRCTWQIGRYALAQFLLGGIAFAVTLLTDGLVYWAAEAALTLASTVYSVYVLRQKTRLWESLIRKVRNGNPIPRRGNCN